MAEDGTHDGRDPSRRIWEELGRMRDAEARFAEALEAMRRARRQVEVIAREIRRDEERVRALVREELRGHPPDATAPPSPRREASSRREAAPRAWRSDPPAGWAVWLDTPPGSTPDPMGRGPEDRPMSAAPGHANRTETPPSTSGPPPSTPERRADEPSRPSAAPAGSRRPGEGPSEGRRGAVWAMLFAVLATLLVGWLAVRGLQEGSGSPRLAVTSDEDVRSARPPDAVPSEAPAAAPGPLDRLPVDPAAREALYDSLWAARSPLFAPLLDAVAEASSEGDVEDAVSAWREGSMDAQERDLLHSALVQLVLNREIDGQVAIDGQLLRNPCRGRSCSALLNLWEMERERYGLPEIPEDAPTNTAALRRVEVELVLDRMRAENGARATGSL